MLIDERRTTAHHPLPPCASAPGFRAPQLRLLARTLALASCGFGLLSVPHTAVAQAAPSRPAPQAVQQSYDVAGGALAPALRSLASRANLLLTFTEDQTAGKRTAGIRGAYTPEAALATLLVGSGLQAVALGNGGYVLRAAAPTQAPVAQHTRAAPARAARLPALTVSADVLPNATSEGSDSYAAEAVSIGKQARAPREIPQSVSVLTRQRIDDQNIATVEDALQWMTGVSMTDDGFPGTFYARGYSLDVQFDGVPATGALHTQEQLDMAIYDRVEVLRGPAGILQGGGSPGGTINLVRKKPLDHFAASASWSAGSWDNYGASVDVTGPLDAQGRIRGRLVAAGHDRKFFYGGAYSRKTTLYGVVDADLTPTTQLSLAAAIHHSRQSRYEGLPTYADGSFLDVPPSTNLNPDWGWLRFPMQQYNAELTQKLGGDWVGKIAINHQRRSYKTRLYQIDSPVDRDTHTATYEHGGSEGEPRNLGIDVNVSGPLRLFGRKHELVAGVNSERYSEPYKVVWDVYPGLNIFSPGLTQASLPTRYVRGSDSKTKQLGAYGLLRLHPADRLTVVTGGRLSNYDAYSRTLLPKASAWQRDQRARAEFTPFAGVIWDATEAVSLYASYADVFTPQSEIGIGGRLAPRVGWQSEVGVKGEFLGGRLNASLAVFRIRDTNRAILDANNVGCGGSATNDCYVAAGEVQSQGIETEVTGNLTPRWKIFAGHTYNDVRYRRDSDPDVAGQGYLTKIPKHLFKLWTDYSLKEAAANTPWSRLSVGAGMRAQSGISEGAIAQGGYAIVSARLGYAISKDVDASLVVNNLLDRNYYASLRSIKSRNYPGEPRSVMLTLRARF